MRSAFISKPHCIICDYAVRNRTLYQVNSVTGIIDGKKRTRRVRPGETWCTKGELFKVNKNHMRWWSFDRRCPLNPFTHTCLVCGARMCTEDTMCRSCRRNREYL